MTKNHQKDPNSNDQRVPGGIRFIRGAFVFLVIFWLSALMFKTLKMQSKIRLSEVEIAYNIFINSFALYGIYKRKTWFVPVILIYSCWNFVAKFIYVISESAPNTIMMGLKLTDFLIALFYMYLMYFFTRKETKHYFQVKGQILV